MVDLQRTISAPRLQGAFKTTTRMTSGSGLQVLGEEGEWKPKGVTATAAVESGSGSTGASWRPPHHSSGSAWRPLTPLDQGKQEYLYYVL